MTRRSSLLTLCILSSLLTLAPLAIGSPTWLDEGVYAVYEGYAKHLSVSSQFVDLKALADIKVKSLKGIRELPEDAVAIIFPERVRVLVRWEVVSISDELLTMKISMEAPTPVQSITAYIDVDLVTNTMIHSSIELGKNIFWILPKIADGTTIRFGGYPKDIWRKGEVLRNYFLNDKFGARAGAVLFAPDFTYDWESGLLIRWWGMNTWPTVKPKADRLTYKEPFYSISIYGVGAEFRLIETNVLLTPSTLTLERHIMLTLLSSPLVALAILVVMRKR